MKKNIPHIITLTSLCIAILSIIESFDWHFITASYLIFLCILLDTLDGSLARYLNTNSEFGKQLDSLTDMVAFGIAPSILMYNFFELKFENSEIAYISLLIPVFSSLRLANYNIQTNKNTFLGITTPVNAILFSSIPLINAYEKNENILSVLIQQSTIGILIIIMSILLITPFTTFNLRIDSIRDDKRKLFFIFIALCILCIFKFTGLPIIILLYIILSAMNVMN